MPARYPYTLQFITNLALVKDFAIERLYARKFTNINASRNDLFEVLGKPAPVFVPATGYRFADWRTAKVNISLCATAVEVLHQRGSNSGEKASVPWTRSGLIPIPCWGRVVDPPLPVSAMSSRLPGPMPQAKFSRWPLS